jgi:hypothetical protein
MKRQSTEFRKIFGSHLYLIFTKHIEPNSRKTTQLKVGKELNKHFSKEDINNGQKVHEKGLSITNQKENEKSKL